MVSTTVFILWRDFDYDGKQLTGIYTTEDRAFDAMTEHAKRNGAEVLTTSQVRSGGGVKSYEVVIDRKNGSNPVALGFDIEAVELDQHIRP